MALSSSELRSVIIILLNVSRTASALRDRVRAQSNQIGLKPKAARKRFLT
jgi:hypothetical protein